MAPDRSANAGRGAAFAVAYRRHRFAALFVTLLLTLGSGATLARFAPRYNPLEVLLALNLVAAIATVGREGEGRLLLAALVGLFLVTRALPPVLGVEEALPLGDALWIFGVVLATVASGRHALRRGPVDEERILAALDAYLLMGLLFGGAYRLLDQVWPGSFGGVAADGLDFGRAIYFSFVTIATLGYGDVVPVSEPARGLAIVEGVSGQMYMTVLVARLVSLYSQQREE